MYKVHAPGILKPHLLLFICFAGLRREDISTRLCYGSPELDEWKARVFALSLNDYSLGNKTTIRSRAKLSWLAKAIPIA